MPESLDLDALREKAEKATPSSPDSIPAYHLTSKWVPANLRHEYDAFLDVATPDVILAVLALVDEQRARISTLEGLAGDLLTVDGYLPWCDDKTCSNPVCIAAIALQEALAGSPAEKEPS